MTYSQYGMNSAPREPHSTSALCWPGPDLGPLFLLYKILLLLYIYNINMINIYIL